MLKKKRQNILITGAGGFVGKNLNEWLSPKYNVYPMCHAELNLLEASAVKNFFDSYPIDIVLHCASVGGSRVSNYDTNSFDIVEKNLRMFLNLERLLPASAKMFHFGSGAEYSKEFYQSKMDERYFDTHVPSDAYGFAKYAISKYISSKNNIVCFRIFGLYGKYEDYRFKFISNAIVKNLLHLPILINQNVIFDYLYIEDFNKIIEHFIEYTPRHRHYNISPTNSIDLLAIANLINKTSDFISEIRILNKGMNREYSGNNNLLQAELKNFDFTSYEQGIRKLYAYYKSIVSELDCETIRNDPYIKHCFTKTSLDTK